jgi:hypothetical protein
LLAKTFLIRQLSFELTDNPFSQRAALQKRHVSMSAQQCLIRRRLKPAEHLQHVVNQTFAGVINQNERFGHQIGAARRPGKRAKCRPAGSRPTACIAIRPNSWSSVTICFQAGNPAVVGLWTLRSVALRAPLSRGVPFSTTQDCNLNSNSSTKKRIKFLNACFRSLNENVISRMTCLCHTKRLTIMKNV